MNQSLEEWIFRHVSLRASGAAALFLWRNDPVVVVGRHQNAFTECRLAAMDSRGVLLARRESGGGAVYQDLGNTNYTLLGHRDGMAREATQALLCRAASALGARLEPRGRNDLVLLEEGREGGERKVSGAAFRQSGERALHHGTMLIDVALGALGGLLTPSRAKLRSKGVASVAARVANVGAHVPGFSHDAFVRVVVDEFCRSEGLGHVEPLLLEEADVLEKPELRRYHEHFADWAWRFGRSPEFGVQLERRFDWGSLDLRVEAERGGVVSDAAIFSDALDPLMIERLQAALLGRTYDPRGIRDAVAAVREELPHAKDHLAEFEDWLLSEI